MPDDPGIDWHQTTFFGIEIDAVDGWHVGHFTEAAPLDDTLGTVVIATETGGVSVMVQGAHLGQFRPAAFLHWLYRRAAARTGVSQEVDVPSIVNSLALTTSDPPRPE